MTLKAKLSVVLLIFVVAVAVTWLFTSPAFHLGRIEISVEGGSGTIPAQAQARLATLVGSSIFALRLGGEQQRLKALPVVADASLSRILPSTLVAYLRLVDSPLVIQSEDGRFFIIKEGRPVAIEQSDARAYQKRVMTVEVTSLYADIMVEWGLDHGMAHVMELGPSLEGKSSLITRIKYDNNSSNSFGKMVLELPSLNAQLRVREPVDAPRLQAAIELIERDQAEMLSFLSTETRRYDLYRSALVRR
jgi:hypothetical protein